jgi:hypothetical protein
MWASIKSILKDDRTKCIIVEDGEPRYIVIPFEEYEQLRKLGKNSIVGENSRTFGEDEINGEIQEMRDEEGDGPVPSAVKLEDLPF